MRSCHEEALRHGADHGGDRDRAGHPGRHHGGARVAATAGAILAVAAAAIAALARRAPLRLVLGSGSVLQVLVVTAGAIVPAMYILGVIFAGLWVIGIWLGHRVEQASQ